MIKKLVIDMGTETKVPTRGMKKGIISFMDEERRDLRRLVALQRAYVQHGMKDPNEIKNTRLHDE